VKLYYNQGYGAFVDGLWKEGNPHHPDSYEYREWERGFNSAYFKNLEFVNGRKAKKKAPSH